METACEEVEACFVKRVNVKQIVFKQVIFCRKKKNISNWVDKNEKDCTESVS